MGIAVLVELTRMCLKCLLPVCGLDLICSCFAINLEELVGVDIVALGNIVCF